MTLIFAVEASQPDGTSYRAAMVWSLLPLASWFAGLARLI